MISIEGKRMEAFEFYGFDPTKPTVLIIGGSLGARTLNESVEDNYDKLVSSGVQVLWQCGKLYKTALDRHFNGIEAGSIKRVMFIERMDLAYAMADVIISRAGAISVSELCLIGKPTILVPSPNVAEDHQTKNAMALVNKDAALIVKDVDARTTLMDTALTLIKDDSRCKKLSDEILKLGKSNATIEIVDELERIIG